MNILDRIDVGGRLFTLVVIAIAGLFAMQTLAARTVDSSSLETKEAELVHLTELALSIV